MPRAAAADEHNRPRRRASHEINCRMGHLWISSKREGSKFHSRTENKRLWFLKLKEGMSCKSISSIPPSAPAIIRSAAEWGTKEKVNGGRRRKTTRKGERTAAIDIPHSSCASPGIRISSDFSTISRNPAPRIDRVKLARGNGTGSRSSSFGIDSHSEEEMMTPRQTLLTGRGLCYDHLWNMDDLWFGVAETQNPSPFTRGRVEDPYRDLRLDVEEMSYEELLNLGDKIGYVGTGLEEKEIPGCLMIVKDPDNDLAASMSLNDGQRDRKCSICQEKYAQDDEVAILECRHHHHVECIKQWLLKKNSCPICKCAAKKRKAR